MKKTYIDPSGFKSALQKLKSKLDSKFAKEATRVDSLISEDRSSIEFLQRDKADKATTLEGYGITDALPSSTPYAKSNEVGGSASSFVTSINKENRDLPVYFASNEATETSGVSAHSTDLHYNPSTGTLKSKSFEGEFKGVTSSAVEFSSPATIQLKGAITGSASSSHGWEINTEIPADSISGEKISDGSIENSKLKNSKIALGADTVYLGDSVTTLNGFDHITSEVFEGNLSGTASRASADALGNDINTTYVTKYAHAEYENRLATVENKIPTQASPENPLADKSYVIDQINSVSAYYLTATPSGDSFATKSDLDHAIETGAFFFAGQLRVPTKNDYCLVNSDKSHDNLAARYVYQGNGTWAFQYTISQTAFTSAQQKAIDSGITQEYLEEIGSHLASTNNPHGVTAEQLNLAAVATSGDYKDLSNVATLSKKPSTGEGNAVTDISVNDHAITLIKGQTFLTEHPSTDVKDVTHDSKTTTVFSTVDSIERDEFGHLLNVNIKEISLPSTEFAVTYEELVSLKRYNKLTAGSSYKLTDYEFTSCLPNLISGNHRFYITLEALSSNMLSPDVILSSVENDTYFSGYHLDQWKVRYSLENDLLKYPWGSIDGKGIIYYMKDHNNNECCYDFKNAMFYRDASKYSSLNESRHFYTFSQFLPVQNGYDVADASNLYCCDNHISLCNNNIGDNIFIYAGGDSISNNFLENCSNNTFVGETSNNSLRISSNNEFFGPTINNYFEPNFSNNTIRAEFSNNSVLSSVENNIFYRKISFSTLDHSLRFSKIYTSLDRCLIGGTSYLYLECFADDGVTPFDTAEHALLCNIVLDRSVHGNEDASLHVNLPAEVTAPRGVATVTLDSLSHLLCKWVSDKKNEICYYKDNIYSREWLLAPREYLRLDDIATVAVSGDYGDLTNKPSLSVAGSEGTGNAVTGILVNGHEITLSKETVFLKPEDIQKTSEEELSEILHLFDTSQ